MSGLAFSADAGKEMAGRQPGVCLAALWVVISIMRRRSALAEWCREAGSVAG
jgi:hypothetical protein